MKYDSDKDYIYYPGSTVPVNKLEIENAEEIEALETQLFLKTYEHFHESLNENTLFNQKYLKDLHKFAFAKLYTWAGKYRNKNISKGDTVFCQAVHLKTVADKIFTEIRGDNYLRDFRDKPKEEFAKKIAYYMCELIALHPFFELNGRVTRLFFDMVAVYNGYNYIDYGDISSRKDNAFIQASKHCMNGDCVAMEKIVVNGLKHNLGR
ncbi:cell filamentation protein Fic [Candidatus Peregrinibacteria bacterium]|jgi:cell filamentation protein|nr:cell filamentation protein Fic [Candidatus Peregrinibacteria bacterium]MBT4055588.1 cell filamentation protein Fic [Candidatus Peregrinibacteria bacterium]